MCILPFRTGLVCVFLSLFYSSHAMDYHVTVASFSFTPAILHIQVGDRVIWTNAGGEHNVSAGNGEFRNEVSGANWEFIHQFNTPGTFGYVCEPHSFLMKGTIIVHGANIPPTVTLTSPAPSAVFLSNDRIELTAQAEDDWEISKVEFFDGSTLLSTLTAPPFTFVPSLAAGSHSLRAVATDNQNAAATSSIVNVTVEANLRPSIKILQPTPEKVFATGKRVDLSVDASDRDGQVARVDYYLNNILVGTSTASPFNLSFTNSTSGRFQLKAIATDNAGATQPSSEIWIYGQNPPVLQVQPAPPGRIGFSVYEVYGCATLQYTTDLNSNNWIDYDLSCPGGGGIGYEYFTNLKLCFFRVKVQ